MNLDKKCNLKVHVNILLFFVLFPRSLKFNISSVHSDNFKKLSLLKTLKNVLVKFYTYLFG